MPKIQNGKYRNLYGQITEVIGIAQHTENGSLLVLHFLDDKEILATPYSDFLGTVSGKARYTFIPESDDTPLDFPFVPEGDETILTIPECEHSELSRPAGALMIQVERL